MTEVHNFISLHSLHSDWHRLPIALLIRMSYSLSAY